MAVLNSRALQEQLSAIMGALTKAVVAQICELVDEGYSLLQMEISRSRKENQDLKKKLHLIESIVVRGGGGGGGTRGAAVGPESFVSAGDTELQPDTEHGAAAPEAGGGAGGGAADELPEVVLIKDEDSDSEHAVEEDGAKASGGGAAAASEAVVLLPVGQRARQHRAGSHAGDRRSVLDQPSLKVCKVTVGPQKMSTSGYVLDSPRNEPGLSGQHAVGDGGQATEAVCSYGSHSGADVQLVHQDCQQMSTGAAEQLSYFGDGALMESDPNRADLDFSPMWDKQSKGQLGFAHFHPNESPDGDGFGIRLVSVAGSMSTDSQLSESGSSGFEYENVLPLHRDCQTGAGGRGKRFLCSICSRTYATSQNLEVHLRIHTGERPFSCEQCGKKFTQSAHLKSHMSIHSGERPYPCRICSRSFIVRYSLKLHMKKCHPNVPNE